MVLKGPTEVIIIIKFIINIIMIIIMMLPTVGDPSWAHSAAHPTESPPSHLLHCYFTYDHHDGDDDDDDGDEASITLLPV